LIIGKEEIRIRIKVYNNGNILGIFYNVFVASWPLGNRRRKHLGHYYFNSQNIASHAAVNFTAG